MNDPNTPSLDDALDQLYAAGPGKDAARQAQAKLDEALNEAAQEAVFYDLIPGSSIGPVFVALNRRGLVAIELGGDEVSFVNRLEARFDVPVVHSPEKTQAARSQIRAYLAGERSTFDLPVDISHLTPFQKQVLRTALQIPAGQVRTYGDIAHEIDKPRAARAVGQALGRNPIPLVIPCHRVIASDGSLGGYSAPGGLRTKRDLLNLEGAALGL